MDDDTAPNQDGTAKSYNNERPSIKARKRGSSLISPPYWQHVRNASYISQASLDPPPIRLEDNTGSQSETHHALWAKAISIDDYVIVRGNPTGIGAYVVWNIKVQTLDGGPITIRKRYSEFDELRQRLAKAFPQSTKASLPPLPPKSAIYKFRPKFLEQRKAGLNHFLNCILLSPEYSGSHIVRNFIFAHDSPADAGPNRQRLS